MNKIFIKTFLFCVLLFLLAIPVAMAADESNLNTVEGMQGTTPPSGTTVTGSNTYTNFSPEKAIDRDLNTRWLSAGYSGTFQLDFPKNVSLNFIQIAALAAPESNYSFTVYGKQDGTWKAISPNMSKHVYNKPTITDPIAVTKGSYSGLKIEINGGSSWVAISEITLGVADKIKVTNLEAKPENSQVTLKWDQTENAESYTVKYGTESGKYTETATATKDTYGNFVIPGLTNGTKYYFVVSAKVNGADSEYSNEASATPQGGGSQPDPEPTTGDRAILVVTMTTGLEKEFDLSIKEVNDFIAWYEGKQAGSGSASYAINKHDNNKGPFSSRKDYMLYDRILTFEVSEYSK
ncbi:fibronectin type III domain-containing protein [Paenibacillus polymyxa]|uniref:fibronectin type III domain-containing protein n=1 Tax=Paenibacillus polymyxa TaxID=1406 RepID=UPI00287FE3AD|nr:fibronectin type III domain-containing protein [Paenibacillus polymyxa]